MLSSLTTWNEPPQRPDTGKVELTKNGGSVVLGPKRKGLATGESFSCVRFWFARGKVQMQGKSTG